MSERENLTNVIKVLYQWRKFIMVVCAATLIGSIVVSLMLDNYYQSTTLFYATSHDLAKPNPIGLNDKNNFYYGTGDDIDRIMTIAESETLANWLIDSFHLYQHYGVDDEKKKDLKVYEIFKSQYKVIKTKYDAIEILVEDYKPEIAMNIANAARNKTNDMAKEMIQQGQRQQMEMMKNNLANRHQKIKDLEANLLDLRTKYGIFNNRLDSDNLSELRLSATAKLNRESARLAELKKHSNVPQDTIIYSQARVEGLQRELSVLNQEKQKFAEGFSRTEILHNLHKVENEEAAYEEQRLKQLEAAYNSDFAAIHVIEKATKPRDKSRPKRSIIVLVSLILAFVLSAIAALIVNSYRQINWEEILSDS